MLLYLKIVFFGIKILTYPPNNTNSRIIEDTTVTGRHNLPINSSMSDAALRRGIKESLNQYEYDRAYHLQLNEVFRASRAQQNINRIHELIERSTTPSLTALTIGSPTTTAHSPSSESRRPALELTSSSNSTWIESRQLTTLTASPTVRSPTAGQIEDYFMH